MAIYLSGDNTRIWNQWDTNLMAWSFVGTQVIRVNSLVTAKWTQSIGKIVHKMYHVSFTCPKLLCIL